MGLINNLKDKFNKAEFTVAPQKKLKTLSKEFLDAFDQLWREGSNQGQGWKNLRS